MKPAQQQALIFVGVAAAVVGVAWLFLGPDGRNGNGVRPAGARADLAGGGDGREGPLGPDDRPRAGLAAANEPLEPGYVIVGGVKRKATDVAPLPAAAPPQETKEDLAKRVIDYGETPRLPEDLNPAVKAAAAAIRDKKRFPERLSVAVLPKPFDAAAYKTNPQAYLDVVEPGRVFQSAQPGPGVPRLESVSPYVQQAIQGQSVPLQVQAPPGAPVTFTSFDLGQFAENQLSSVTVKADADGLATANFIGSPGTIADVNILAASPLASAQAKFVVNVQLPKTTD